MHRKKSYVGKHIDFIVLDMACMQLAFILSYVIRHGFWPEHFFRIYQPIDGILILSQLCVLLLTENLKNIIRRGAFQELKKTVFMVSLTEMLVFVYLFVCKRSVIFSRAVFLLTWVFASVFVFVERSIRKQIVRKNLQKAEKLKNLILISSQQRVLRTIEKMKSRSYRPFAIRGILFLECERCASAYDNIPVLGNVTEDLESVLVKNVVDEIFLDSSFNEEQWKMIRDKCSTLGILLHQNIDVFGEDDLPAVLENFAGHKVLTFGTRYVTMRQYVVKRMMDIVGAVVGLLITGVLTLVLGPIIRLQSPGPVFFSQERIGLNGRKFRIYKFRSMYQDAEERKKELLAQNKMQGLMFKVNDDPRVTPIGRFIRKTSLDEFPQFWNVLKGDMSLVGTRPPTVDEYEKYKLHHKARLSIKPGVTGLWQISGRSDILDFEEIVRLDLKYIQEWNIGMDCWILLQTVKLIFSGEGAV